MISCTEPLLQHTSHHDWPTGVSRVDGKMPRWNHIGTMEAREATSLGCHVFRHFCTFIRGRCSTRARDCSSSRKKTKYSNLLSSHVFTPVAIETSGVFGPETEAFIKELGRRLWQVTEQSHQHLVQRLSIALQRGNAASVLGTLSKDADFGD